MLYLKCSYKYYCSHITTFGYVYNASLDIAAYYSYVCRPWHAILNLGRPCCPKLNCCNSEGNCGRNREEENVALLQNNHDMLQINFRNQEVEQRIAQMFQFHFHCQVMSLAYHTVRLILVAVRNPTYKL